MQSAIIDKPMRSIAQQKQRDTKRFKGKECKLCATHCWPIFKRGQVGVDFQGWGGGWGQNTAYSGVGGLFGAKNALSSPYGPFCPARGPVSGGGGLVSGGPAAPLVSGGGPAARGPAFFFGPFPAAPFQPGGPAFFFGQNFPAAARRGRGLLLPRVFF